MKKLYVKDVIQFVICMILIGIFIKFNKVDYEKEI